MEKTIHADVGLIAQALKFQIRAGKQWEELSPAAKESLDQIATLIARTVSGESTHWESIASYAQAAQPFDPRNRPVDAATVLELERGMRSLVREIPRRDPPDGAA